MQRTARQYKEIFWILLLLLSIALESGCKRTATIAHKPGTKQAKKIRKSSKKKANNIKKEKEVLHIKAVSSNGPTSYVMITVYPWASGHDINQYYLENQTITEGKGILLAPSEKVKGKFNYNLPLSKKPSLGTIFFNKGTPADFEQGKPVTFKCLYQPALGVAKGDIHSLKIRLIQSDQDGNLLQQKDIAFDLTIKKDITAPTTSNQKSKESKKNNY